MASLFRRVRVDQRIPDAPSYLTTPDGRYFVVNDRLWRMINPALSQEIKESWVNRLMEARMRVGTALKKRDKAMEIAARTEVDEAKRALGEHGPTWWSNGAPNYNRHLATDTPYAAWYAEAAKSQG